MYCDLLFLLSRVFTYSRGFLQTERQTDYHLVRLLIVNIGRRAAGGT